MSEGDGAKEKLGARKKNRPQGWGEYAVLNRIREEDRQRLQREPALFLSQARAAEQRGGTEEEMRADCESLVRTGSFTVTSG